MWKSLRKEVKRLYHQLRSHPAPGPREPQVTPGTHAPARVQTCFIQVICSRSQRHHVAPFHSFHFLPQSTLLGRSGHTLIHNAKFSSPVLNPAIGPVPLMGSCFVLASPVEPPCLGHGTWTSHLVTPTTRQDINTSS